MSASHNHIDDNGIKISDKSGGMFPAEKEKLVKDFCNAKVLNQHIQV